MPSGPPPSGALGRSGGVGGVGGGIRNSLDAGGVGAEVPAGGDGGGAVEGDNREWMLEGVWGPWVAFPCHRWLSTEVDDCRISRTLFAGHQSPVHTYKVWQRFRALCIPNIEYSFHLQEWDLVAAKLCIGGCFPESETDGARPTSRHTHPASPTFIIAGFCVHATSRLPLPMCIQVKANTSSPPTFNLTQVVAVSPLAVAPIRERCILVRIHASSSLCVCNPPAAAPDVHSSPGQHIEFPCPYLSKLVVVEPPAVAPIHELCIQVQTHTSDIRGASTDANVHLIMHGTLGDGKRHILSSGPNDFERLVLKVMERGGGGERSERWNIRGFHSSDCFQQQEDELKMFGFCDVTLHVFSMSVLSCIK
eukprot:scaffold103300_cov17-Tisochrysis_lutea.AAC.1